MYANAGVRFIRVFCCIDLFTIKWPVTLHGKILEEKIIGKSWAICVTNIHRYTKSVFGICTDCNLFAKFFLTNSFYLYSSPKFCHVRVYTILLTFFTICLYSTKHSNRTNTYWFECTGFDDSKIFIRNKWLSKQYVIPHSSMLYPCFLNKEHHKIYLYNIYNKTCVTMPNPSLSLEIYTCPYVAHVMITWWSHVTHVHIPLPGWYSSQQ